MLRLSGFVLFTVGVLPIGVGAANDRVFVNPVAISSDGQLVAAGDRDGTVTIHSCADGRQRGKVSVSRGRILGGLDCFQQIAISWFSTEPPVGGWLIVDEKGGTLATAATADTPYSSVVYGQDGTRLAVLIVSGVELWSTKFNKRVWRQVIAEDRLAEHVGISRDGKTVAIVHSAISELANSNRESAISIFGDPTQQKPIHIDKAGASIECIRFSPTGDFFVSGGGPNDAQAKGGDSIQPSKAELAIWPLESIDKPRRIITPHGRITLVSFSPDGKLAVVAGFGPGKYATTPDYHRLSVWNTDEWKQVGTLEGHPFDVSAVKAISDKVAVSVAAGGEIRRWNLKTGECEGTVQIRRD